MEKELPEAYAKFLENVDKLEHYFKDMQDVEFTVEKGKLWMLQCRNGKRTGVAAIRIATELVAEGICTESEALLKASLAMQFQTCADLRALHLLTNCLLFIL